MRFKKCCWQAFNCSRMVDQLGSFVALTCCSARAVAAQDYGELEQSIRSVLDVRGLQSPPDFVTKILQLYETMNVRFGVMLVGPTGGGKTCCYQTLQVRGLHPRPKTPSDGIPACGGC
jgi:hypothetical protein